MIKHHASDTENWARAAKKSRSVIILDKSALFREGIRLILNTSSFEVIASGGTLQAVVNELQASPAAQGETMALLLCSVDPHLRIAPQLAAIKTLRQMTTESKTVVLMPSCTAEVVIAAVLSGADAVLMNDISGEKLISALEVVMSGQHVLPLNVALEVFAMLRSVIGPDGQPEAATLQPLALPDPAPSGRIDIVVPTTAARLAQAATRLESATTSQPRNLGLSERETQILQCLVEGYANKLIARRLDIAEATVKVHIKGLLRKINVSNRTQAAIWALNQSVGSRPSAKEPAAKSAPPVDLDKATDVISLFHPVAAEVVRPQSV